ncbi:MAG: hypothetical protein VXX79_18455, partial [Pseudomonadota bacterium]|nr:hypothetical protein [Pseudomonadota bacterium]
DLRGEGGAMSKAPDYYYEHENGSVIRKPAIVVDSGGGPWQYFSGPFVRRWWTSDDWPEDLERPE